MFVLILVVWHNCWGVSCYCWFCWFLLIVLLFVLLFELEVLDGCFVYCCACRFLFLFWGVICYCWVAAWTNGVVMV